MTADLQSLLKSGAIERCTVADLKARLKSLKISATGEKGTLIARLRLYIDGEKYKVDGSNPTQLSLPVLRKAVASRGLSCIGTQDEMLVLLMDYLKQNTTPEESGAANGITSSANASDPATQAVKIARRAIEMSEEGDYEGVLSILGEKVTRASSVGVMRKAYLKLSLLLHPDKLGDKFEGATKAFQAVVTAFENLSRPELPKGKEGEKAKGPMVMRSNEGCYETKVTCPRCRVEWGQKVEGNPDYYYTFMMMGLKNFTCATCLLQFGCMTAVHRCPFCRACFEYHPDDFHRKIKCSRPKCQKEFGFWIHHIPERVLQDLHREVKAAQEWRLKNEESKRRRAASALKRTVSRSAEEEARHQEQLFILGLKDTCPRCGESLEGLPDEEEQRRHLMECSDSTKIAQHKARLEKEAMKAAEKERKQSLQDEVSAQAAFQLMGGQSQHLWLLSEEQLRKQCAQSDLPTTGTKEELIIRLAAHRKDQKFLTAGDEADIVPEVTADSLPSNLHGMSEAQLRAICASHNIDPAPLKSKKALIKALEAAQYASFLGGPKVALLVQPPSRQLLKERPAKRTSKRLVDSDSDSEIVAPKKQRKGKGKRKVVDMSSDDEDFTVKEAEVDVDDID